MNIPQLIQTNHSKWLKVNIEGSRRKEVMNVGLKICAQKKRYQALEKSTGVPWFVIGIIHEREASGDFSRNIAQGDRWDRVSVHVPKGRGPFTSFEAAAIDALTKCPPYASKWTDWSAGGCLTLLEMYNGLGYEQYHHEASPYLWGATDMEERGKYIADGVYDKNVWDTQIGSAAMLKAMMTIDPSILSMSGPALLKPQAAAEGKVPVSAPPQKAEKVNPEPSKEKPQPEPGLVEDVIELVESVFKK